MKISSVELLQQIELTLRELIDVAEQLNLLSQQSLLEEEINLLQEKEVKLLNQLQELDHSLTEREGSQEIERFLKESPILSLLDRFQKLNQRFIENIGAKEGTIQFKQKDET